MGDGIFAWAAGRNAIPDLNSSVAMKQGIYMSIALLSAFLSMHLVLRHWYPQIYFPKTSLGRRYERLERPSRNPIKMLIVMYKITDADLIRSCGLDAFFFLRYIQLMLYLFTALSVLILPVLLPVNYFGGVEDDAPAIDINPTFFDMIALEHIKQDEPQYYWAHSVMAFELVGIVCFFFLKAMKHFVAVRGTWLQPYNRLDKRSSGIILLASIPKELLDVDKLTRYFAECGAGVARVSINRDVSKITLKIDERHTLIRLLEKEETNFIIKAKRRAQKNLKAAEDAQEEDQAAEDAHDTSDEKWRMYLQDKDRTKIRIGLFSKEFPFGRMEDAIVHYRNEISRLNDEIEAMRNTDLAILDSAFIRFKTRSGALLALRRPQPSSSKMKIIAVEPSYEDVIWPNIAPGYYSHKFFQVLNFVQVSMVIILYSIPVILAAAFSQMSALLELDFSEVFKFEGSGSHLQLGFLNALKKPFASGDGKWENNRWLARAIELVLPTLIIMLTELSIPFALCNFAVRQGAATRAHVQLMVQRGLFAFLFVQIFLVGSISAASIGTLINNAIDQLSSGAREITEPAMVGQIIMVLALELPLSTNFFICLLIFQGAFTAGDEIGQFSNWFFEVWHWLRSSLGKTRTPRQVWKRRNYLPQCELAITFPLITLFACIVLAFSIIQPCILVIGVIVFGLLWVGFGYSFLYVKRVSGGRNGTNGLMFLSAINHTFCGVYVMELCAMGFSSHLATAEKDHVNFHAVWQGVSTSILFLLTIAFHCFFNRYFRKVGCGLYGDYRLEEALDAENHTDADDYDPEALRKAKQRAIWLPDDGNDGIARDEARLCIEAGVWAVVGGAIVREKGRIRLGRREKHIAVEGIPPEVEMGFEVTSDMSMAGYWGGAEKCD